MVPRSTMVAGSTMAAPHVWGTSLAVHFMYSYVPNKRRATLIFRTCFCLQCDAYLVPFYTETLQKINNIYHGYYGICYVWVLSAGNKCLSLIAQGVKWAMLISAGVPHMHPGVRWTPIISLTTTRRLFGDFLTPRRLFTAHAIVHSATLNTVIYTETFIRHIRVMEKSICECFPYMNFS